MCFDDSTINSINVLKTQMYKKIGKKNKKDDRPDPDADYQEGEEEDYLKELEDDGNLKEDGEGPKNSSDGW